MRRALLLLISCLVLATSAQPWVPPEFSAPAGSAPNTDTPAKLSNARIMGICTVCVLFTAFAILTIVVCTRKDKVKPIDLDKPLILTSEVGKKKKRKGKDKKKADAVAAAPAVAIPVEPAATMEIPPSSSELGHNTNEELSDGSENASSSDEE